MKEVKQIGLDILVDENINGSNLAEEVAHFLEENGYTVLGAMFHEDLTDVYRDEYGYSME